MHNKTSQLQVAAALALTFAAPLADAALVTTADIDALIQAGAFKVNYNAPTIKIGGVTVSGINVSSDVPVSFIAAPDATGMPVAKLAAPVTFTLSYLAPITNVRTTAATVKLSDLVLNPDPAVTWNVTATNLFPTALPFAFSFSAPLSPSISGPTIASSQIGGSLQDGGSNGVTLTPISTFIQNPVVFAGSTPVSTNAPSGALGTGSGGGVAANYVYALGSSGSVPGPSGGPFTLLTTNILFTLSGGGDSASLSGNATINPVPLPAAAWLLLTGLAGLGVFGRKRSLSA
jgi:hypothetical protein